MLPFKFSTFTAALEITGLANELRSKPSLTVFAPENSAFKKLGCHLWELFSPFHRESLLKLLKYHIVETVEYSPDLTQQKTLTTMEGSSVSVKTVNEKGLKKSVLVVNGVSTAWLEDLPLANGVVHGVDEVLVPEGLVIGKCSQ